MFDKLVSFFEEQGWVFRILPDTKIISFGLNTEKARYSCYISISSNDDSYTFYVHHPLIVPDTKRIPIIILSNQFNSNLSLGNLSVSKSNEIILKISAISEVDGIKTPTFSRTINLGIGFMDDVIDVYNTLMYDTISLEVALEKADELYRASTIRKSE